MPTSDAFDQRATTVSRIRDSYVDPMDRHDTKPNILSQSGESDYHSHNHRKRRERHKKKFSKQISK